MKTLVAFALICIPCSAGTFSPADKREQDEAFAILMTIYTKPETAAYCERYTHSTLNIEHEGMILAVDCRTRNEYLALHPELAAGAAYETALGRKWLYRELPKEHRTNPAN